MFPYPVTYVTVFMQDHVFLGLSVQRENCGTAYWLELSKEVENISQGPWEEQLPSADCLNSLRCLGRAQLTCALSFCVLKSNGHLERVALQTSVASCILQIIKFLWSVCTTMLSAFLSNQPASELEKCRKTMSFHWISLVTAGSSLASSHLFLKFLTSACLYLKLHTLLFIGQSHANLCHKTSAFRGHFTLLSQVR